MQKTEPTARQPVDCAIIGAGPAGLSAATWLRNLEIPFLLVEQEPSIGGDVEHIHGPITNYLGVRAVDGHAFMTEVRHQIEADGLPVLCGRRVLRIEPVQRTVHLPDLCIEARSLVLAMGLRRRELPLPALDRFRGAGVTLSATNDLDHIRGHAVAVVGGGDGAVENALILADLCPRVHLIVRSSTPHGRRSFFERARAHARIAVHMSCEVVDADGDDNGLSAIRVCGPAADDWIPVRHLVTKIGFAPNVEAIVPGALTLNRDGYVVTDAYMRTSVPGVFATGDLRNPRSPSLAAAVGDGALAAREVAFHLGRLVPPDERERLP